MHAGPQRRWRSFTLELLVFFPGCALPSGTPGSRGHGAPRQNQRPQDRNKMKAVERTVRETSNMFSFSFFPQRNQRNAMCGRHHRVHIYTRRSCTLHIGSKGAASPFVTSYRQYPRFLPIPRNKHLLDACRWLQLCVFDTRPSPCIKCLILNKQRDTGYSASCVSRKSSCTYLCIGSPLSV